MQMLLTPEAPSSPSVPCGCAASSLHDIVTDSKGKQELCTVYTYLQYKLHYYELHSEESFQV